ncbi:MAG: TAXI family TRAP transporter solute-binding subunit [Proteobacteria bacterium]|nr:TAXI family TRAP transporter solute-binding subunit [Pseudomonadota bacterium]
MRKFLLYPTVALATLVCVGSASAQTVGIGSTKGGVLAAVVATVAKVVTLQSDVKMRPQPMGGTQQYIPVVNAGELPFGISNAVQFNMALSGTGISKRKYPNLRVVAQLMTFRTGPIVAGNSSIKRLSDIRGKRVPYGFKAAPLFQHVFTGYLTNAGLTWDDVVKVPTVALRQNWDLFKQGKTDLSIGNPGSGLNKSLIAAINGGIRHVTLNTNTPGAAKLLNDLPKMFYYQVGPDKKYPAVSQNVHLVGMNFLLWTHKGADEKLIHKVTKALYESEANLKEAGPVWGNYKTANMANDNGGVFHPGAVRLYKEKGVWKR